MQAAHVVFGQIFGFGLGAAPQRGVDDGPAGKLRHQPPRQVRGQGGRRVALHIQRLIQRIFNILGRKQVLPPELPQPAVALGQNPVVVFAQHQHARLVGNDGQRHGLGQGQVVGRLLKVEQRGRFHAFNIAAVGHQVQVELENFGLAVVGLQLRGAQHFEQLIAEGALLGLQQAGHLHGNGAGPGGAAGSENVPPGSLHYRQRIDPKMVVKIPVLLVNNGLL